MKRALTQRTVCIGLLLALIPLIYAVVLALIPLIYPVVFRLFYVSTPQSATKAQNMRKFVPGSTDPPPLGDWTSEPWTGGDRPFLQAKTEVEKAIVSNTPIQLLKKYQQEAEQNPSDALSQFRWGYCFMRTFTELPDVHRYQHLSGISAALEAVKSPQSYEYARLRFLILRLDKHISGLEVLGERLLRRDPNDQAVKINMVDVLSFSSKPGASERALKYVQEAVKRNPTYPNNYSVLGSAFLARWLKRKNPVDADRAISAYQQYLHLAPADDPWKERAQILIDSITRDKIRVAKELKSKR